MTYCVYLTIYRGNKLPPFYVGYTTMEKIESGYKGSVSSREYKITWREETINNPQLFEVHVLFRCETKAEATAKEHKLQRQLGVVRNPLYVNKCSFPQYDWSGKKRPNLSEYNRTRVNPNKGKKFPGKTHTEETKQQISATMKGRPRPPEVVAKIKASHQARAAARRASQF